MLGWVELVWLVGLLSFGLVGLISLVGLLSFVGLIWFFGLL